MIKVPPPRIYTESIHQMFDRYVEACVWFETFGLNINRSRIGEYKRFLENFIASEALDNDVKDKEQYVKYFHFLRESQEITWIYQGLRRIESTHFIATFKKSLGGNAFISNDKITDSSRDYQFELRIASYFLMSGFNVDLSGDADIVIRLPNYTVYIECKRLKSKKNFHKRLSEANSQLRNRYISHQDNTKAIGIVVLDVGLMANPESEFAYFETHREVTEFLHNQVSTFIETANLRKYFVKDKRTIAVWTHMMCPAITVEPPNVAVRFQSLVKPFVSLHGERGSILESFRIAFLQNEDRKTL
jgi:hypothetical protein